MLSEEFNSTTSISHRRQGRVRFRADGPDWRTQYWDTFITDLAGQNPHVNNPGLEIQYFAPEALSTVDGNLRIRATRNERSPMLNQHPGFEYTSGLIQSDEFFTPTYGVFETRMRMPGGPSQWPAFWLFASGYKVGDRYAEIDIMECFGSNSEVMTTVHGAAGAKTSAGKSVGNVNTWNTFTGVWAPTDIRTYVNGEQIFSTTSSSYLYAKPMMLILNMAMGNHLGEGRPDSVVTEVDYVRAWSL